MVKQFLNLLFAKKEDKSLDPIMIDFLPGALAIQEKPPNPAAKWLFRSLAMLFVLTVMWACFGKVDVVVTAEGKLLPSERVKHIQPLEKSIVKKIFVREGDYVETGTPLVELDATIFDADSRRLQSDLMMNIALLQVAEHLLVSIGNNLEGNFYDFSLDDTSEVMFSDEQRKVFFALRNERWHDYKLQSAMHHSENESIKFGVNASAEQIKKLEQTLPIATQRANNFASLKNQQYVSENDYWLAEQDRIQQAQDLASEISRNDQLASNLQAAYLNADNYKAQYKSQLLTEVAQLTATVSSLKEELIKANALGKKQVLYSPVDGHVQELVINTEGGVVTDAQQLMIIVPDDTTLEAEVYLENKDIGFVDASMSVEIKVHTFPFTKYGVVDATIKTISDDATVDESLGLIYRVQLNLDKDDIGLGMKAVKLMLGMSITAEVAIGERRIVEFFLAPLLKHSSEAITER